MSIAVAVGSQDILKSTFKSQALTNYIPPTRRLVVCQVEALVEPSYEGVRPRLLAALIIMHLQGHDVRICSGTIAKSTYDRLITSAADVVIPQLREENIQITDAQENEIRQKILPVQIYPDPQAKANLLIAKYCRMNHDRMVTLHELEGVLDDFLNQRPLDATICKIPYRAWYPA